MTTDLPDFHLLIPAAGNGQRTGLATPKQYQKINGKSVLYHVIKHLSSFKNPKTIRIVIGAEHADLYHDAVQGLNLAPPATGGKTRKNSIFNGLKSFSDLSGNEIILIHDAARPFVSHETFYALLKAAQTHGAATPVCPLADTIIQNDGSPVDRNKLQAVQTPQAFRLGLIRQAHEQFSEDDSFTDDAGLVEATGHRVHHVPGSRMNFKITTAEDLKMAETLLTRQMETRTGTGFDVHAFADDPAESIRLGGIDIPYTQALSGHSDADVALHALTDALLGTIAAGDIGSRFPPSDPQWKGADSALFLQDAARLIQEQGGQIIHCDLTLICEAPKIGPHRDAMQSRIADLLKISKNRISIKATTTEQLGFTGRKEGIAAQAAATVRLPVQDVDTDAGAHP